MGPQNSGRYRHVVVSSGLTVIFCVYLNKSTRSSSVGGGPRDSTIFSNSEKFIFKRLFQSL